MKAIIRNTLRRNSDEERRIRQFGMQVDLEFFCDGKSLLKAENYRTLQLNEWLVLDEDAFSEIKSVQGAEVLIVATSTLDKATKGFFSQEHQVTYTNEKTGFSSTLLYDQLPILATGKTPNPIVLLAPKCWVGKGLDTYVVFANSIPGLPGPEIQTITFYIINDLGEIVATHQETIKSNGVFVYSLREKLPPHLLSDTEVKFYSVSASGGQSSITISTFVVNQASGCFALEHSLSPHYYLSGDLRKIRSEALVFNNKFQSNEAQ